MPSSPFYRKRQHSGQTVQDKHHARYYSGIRNGLWERKHEEKMGKAVWLFGWLVGRQTTQNGSTGLVLGGKILTWGWVAEKTEWPIRNLQRWSELLRREGYIEIIHAKRGFIVKILNAKKFLHSQESLFPGPPEVASPATNGGDKSGDPRVKSGDPEPPYLLMNPREKAKGRAPHPLHDEIRKWCAGEWEQRFGEKPPWGGRDNKALKELLQVKPELTLPRIQQVWGNYMESSKKFYDDSGWPLWAFCQDFAGLSLHPVHDRGGNHGQARACKPNGSGGTDRLARFRGVERKASELANHTH